MKNLSIIKKAGLVILLFALFLLPSVMLVHAEEKGESDYTDTPTDIIQTENSGESADNDEGSGIQTDITPVENSGESGDTDEDNGTQADAKQDTTNTGILEKLPFMLMSMDDDPTDANWGDDMHAGISFYIPDTPSGATATAELSLNLSSLKTAIPDLTISIPMGNIFDYVDSTFADTTWDKGVLTIDLKDITLKNGGATIDRTFNFIPFKEYVTPDGKGMSHTATLYQGDDIVTVDGDSPVKATAIYEAIAEVEWAINSVEIIPTSVHKLANKTGETLPSITFTYNLANKRDKGIGTELTGKVEFSDTITVPEEVSITESMLTARVISPDSKLVNTATKIDIISTRTDGSIESFKVTYTVTNLSNTADLSAITAIVTIDGATVEDNYGAFEFATGAPLGTAYGIETTYNFNGDRAALGFAPPDAEPEPQPGDTTPKISKTSSPANITPAGSLLDGIYATSTQYTIGGFSNMQADKGATEFTVVDTFTKGDTNLLELTKIDVGQYFYNNNGSEVLYNGTPTISYKTDGDFITISPNNIANIKGITAIKFSFGSVPAGFRCGYAPTLTFAAVAGGNKIETIENTAQVSYKDAESILRESALAKASVTYNDIKDLTFTLNKSNINKTTGRTSPNPYCAGDIIEYTLKIENKQNYPLDKLQITDYLAAAYVDGSTITFTPGLTKNEAGITVNNPAFLLTQPVAKETVTRGDFVNTECYKLQWNLKTGQTIAANSTVYITYQVQIKADAQISTGNTVKNEFWVTGGGIKGGSGTWGGTWNSSGKSSITLSPGILRIGIKKIANLEGEAYNANQTYKDGDTVEYTITVKNIPNGNSTAPLNITKLVDTLPAGLTYIKNSAYLDVGNENVQVEPAIIKTPPATGTPREELTWGSFANNPQLAPDKTYVVKLKAKIDLGLLPAETLATSQSGDITLTNNCFIYPGTNSFTYTLGEWAGSGMPSDGYVANHCDIKITRDHRALINNQASIDGAKFSSTLKGVVAGQDEVTYRITFRSLNDPIHVTQFIDKLPSGVTYKQGSFCYSIGTAPGDGKKVYVDPTISNNTLKYIFPNDTNATGIKLDSAVGKTKTITVEFVATAASSTASTATLTNQAAFYTVEPLTVLGQEQIGPTRYGSKADTGSSADNWDNSNDTPVRYQAECQVTYDGNLVAPKITKTPYIVSTGADARWEKYVEGVSQVFPSSTLGWEIKIENMSGAPISMKDPVVLDLLPKNVAYLTNTTEMTPKTAATLTLSQPKEINDLITGSKVLQWDLQGELKAGAYYTFRFQTQVNSGYFGSLSNTAYLIPHENFNIYEGSLVDTTNQTSQIDKDIAESVTKNLSGHEKLGVKNVQFVSVSGLSGAVSKLTVTDGTSTSTPGEKITTTRNKPVTYTLEVTNKGDNTYTNLVMIDYLPELGDTGVVLNKADRESKFALDIDTNSPFVTPSDKNAVISYSAKTPEDLNADDWQGGGTGWVSDPDDLAGGAETLKSVRVVFTNVPKNETCTVEIDAIVPYNAPIGETAWNSFGFYLTSSQVQNGMTLEPMRAGIEVQDQKNGKLQIKKVLHDSEADAESAFTFTVIGKNANDKEIYNSTTDYPGGEIKIDVKNGPDTVELNGLPFGTYYVEEVPGKILYTISYTDAKNNNVKDTGIVVDNLTANGAIQVVTVTNTRSVTKPDYKFRFFKVDDKGYDVDGAEFTLTDSFNKVVDTVISSFNNPVEFTGLTVGTYTLKETATPSGYVNNTNTYTVEILANHTFTITSKVADGSLTQNHNLVYSIVNTPDGGGGPTPDRDRGSSGGGGAGGGSSNSNGVTEIPTGEVPLGNLPGTTIPEPDVPLGNIPQTGTDNMSRALFLILLTGAILVLAGCLLREHELQKK